MAMIESQLDAGTPKFAENSAYMRSLVADLQQQLAVFELGGGEAARNKHQARGKLLARERVVALLDLDSEFLELSALAGYGMYDGGAPGAGIVAGIGKIHGQETMVLA